MTSETSAEVALRLFAEQVVPLAADHPEQHLAFAAERRDDSYYRPAFRQTLTRADMMRGGQGGELAELAALWAGTPLVALLPGVEELAQVVAKERARKADDPDAPSTLIYQMY